MPEDPAKNGHAEADDMDVDEPSEETFPLSEEEVKNLPDIYEEGQDYGGDIFALLKEQYRERKSDKAHHRVMIGIVYHEHLRAGRLF